MDLQAYIGAHAAACRTDRDYMALALLAAQVSGASGEVPVGAILVHPSRGFLSYGINGRESAKNALWHAEMEAIDRGCRCLGGWRLTGCTLYVTLEPCPMCAGAIINARIRTVYYGADDSKAGSCGSLINLFDVAYNHKPEIVKGLMKEQCSGILTDFFRDLRKKRKEQRKLQRLSQQENQQE